MVIGSSGWGIVVEDIFEQFVCVRLDEHEITCSVEMLLLLLWLWLKLRMVLRWWWVEV